MLSPVYLYTGPEFGERNDSVKAIKEELKKKYGDIDDYVFYADDTPVSDVITLLQSESLFVNARFILLRNSELIKKKDDIEMLSSWISSSLSSAKNKNPKDSAVLVLVSDQVSVDARLEKLVPKTCRKIFWEMFENRKPQWIRNFFSHEGYDITEDAVQSILNLVENNTEALRTECSRFSFCFPPAHKITENDVDIILSHDREESAFTLFDAMTCGTEPVEKRFENALEILQKINLSKDSSPVMIIAGLTSCFRRLELWHEICSNGFEPDEFTLKTKGFTSKKARNLYRSASHVWSKGQTVAIIALLSSTDAMIRSTGTILQNIQLELMLYSILVKKGSFCSIYETTANLP